MKNKTLKVALSLGIALIAVLIFMGVQLSIPLNAGLASSTVTGTFATGQIDTITCIRQAGLSGLSFAIYTADSSNISLVTVRRDFNGVLSPVIAGDTLVTTDSSATARSIIKSVTLAPLAEKYIFIVKYNSNTGGLNQGVTTPNVKYGSIRQYSRGNNP